MRITRGATELTQDPMTTSDSKRIDLRHHYIRELVARNDISIIHSVSDFQHADFPELGVAEGVFFDSS